MGYMTTLTILNDGFNSIEKDPKALIAAIDDAMCGGREGKKNNIGTNFGANTYYIGNGGQIDIAPSYHMDDVKLFLCGCNAMYDLGKVYGIDDKRSIELQLSSIEQAKIILAYSERELKKKLEKLNN